MTEVKKFTYQNLIKVYICHNDLGEQYKYSNDAVLMVYASHAYDEGDYIRNYDEYLARIKHEKNRNIPFLNLKSSYLELKDEFDEAYLRLMDSGSYF